MEFLFSAFSRESDQKSGRADSFSDKLSSKYTVSLLSLFALLSSSTLIIDEPISCWCPTEFTSSQTDYVTKYCWTSITFSVPDSVAVRNTKERRLISFYQWVSLMLAFQAFLFYLPNPLWKIFSKKSGLALSSVTDASSTCRKCPDLEESENNLRYVASTLFNYLNTIGKTHKSRGIFERVVWVPGGNYMSFLYLFIKCLYMANAVGQLYMLNSFLGYKYSLYGLEVLNNISTNSEVFQSKRFPKYAYCTPTIRVLNNNHKYIVQCALPMNMLYEMIFLIIWFWLVFVMVATASSLLKWLALTFVRHLQCSYVLGMLRQSGQLQRFGSCSSSSEEYQKEQVEVDQFVSSFLRRDGCFILMMIDENAGSWVTSKVMGELWLKYLEKKSIRKKIIPEKCLELLKGISDEGIELDNTACPSKNSSLEEVCLKMA